MDYDAPIQVDTPGSERQDTSEVMTKAEWNVKDRQKRKAECIQASSRYHQGKAGQEGSISLDVLTDAKVFFDWVMEE
jgi:hypothetical protein